MSQWDNNFQDNRPSDIPQGLRVVSEASRELDFGEKGIAVTIGTMISDCIQVKLKGKFTREDHPARIVERKNLEDMTQRNEEAKKVIEFERKEKAKLIEMVAQRDTTIREQMEELRWLKKQVVKAAEKNLHRVIKLAADV